MLAWPSQGASGASSPFSQSVLYPRSQFQSQALRSSRAWEIVGGWPRDTKTVSFPGKLLQQNS